MSGQWLPDSPIQSDTELLDNFAAGFCHKNIILVILEVSISNARYKNKARSIVNFSRHAGIVILSIYVCILCLFDLTLSVNLFSRDSDLTSTNVSLSVSLSVRIQYVKVA